jgi:hypothetical protein
VLALRNGISLESLRRPIAAARKLELPAAPAPERIDAETVLAQSA